METVQPDPAPSMPWWQKLRRKLEHKRWGWVMSALAAFFATVSPNVIRILCLLFAVLMAGMAFHGSQMSSGKWKRTVPATILFLVVAAFLLLGANYFDHTQAQGEGRTPNPKQTPPATTNAVPLDATVQSPSTNGVQVGNLAQPVTPSRRKRKTSAVRPAQTAQDSPKPYCRLLRMPPPLLLYTECQNTPFPPAEPSAMFKAQSMNGVFMEGNVSNLGGPLVDVSGTINHATFRYNETLARAPDPTASAVADQLSRLIDEGQKIMASFLQDDNAQLLSEKEKGWNTDAEATLRANLGQIFVDEFQKVQSTSTVYPQGHSAEGGSMYNLIDARIAFLSKFMNQMRAIH